MPGFHKFVSGWYRKDGQVHPVFFEVVWTTPDPVTPEQFQLMLEHYEIVDVEEFDYQEITREEFGELQSG